MASRSRNTPHSQPSAEGHGDAHSAAPAAVEDSYDARKNPQQARKVGRLLLRASLSALALWLVSRRLDFGATLDLVSEVHIVWLVPAVLALVASHALSAERSRVLWRAAGATLTRIYALRLYWLGMFYSIFLPGGVGGDGYKVYVLKQHTPVSWKHLIQAGLLDRGTGVWAIILLSAAMALRWLALPGSWPVWIAAGCLGAIAAYALGIYWVFPRFRTAALANALLSLAKQALQAVSAAFLIVALGVPFHGAYALAFLLSSLALILPISIGGVGARELVLSYLPDTFPIQEEAAVAMSLLFFVLNTAFSLGGALVQALPVGLEAAELPEDGEHKQQEAPMPGGASPGQASSD